MTDTLAAIGADLRALRNRVYAAKRTLTPHDLFWRAWGASMKDGSRSRQWKARAIGLDPEPLHNAIALSGMAPMMVEDRWQLGVALPQPRPHGGHLDPVDDVVLIEPRSGAARVLGDADATHVGPRHHPGKLTILTDARAWARDIALARLEWWHTLSARRRRIQAEPAWSGEPTAALLLAPPAKVRWADLDADILDVPADLHRAVRRAVYAQARLPRIEGRA